MTLFLIGVTCMIVGWPMAGWARNERLHGPGAGRDWLREQRQRHPGGTGTRCLTGARVRQGTD